MEFKYLKDLYNEVKNSKECFDQQVITNSYSFDIIIDKTWFTILLIKKDESEHVQIVSNLYCVEGEAHADLYGEQTLEGIRKHCEVILYCFNKSK